MTDDLDGLTRYDPSREPFAGGIDPRVMGRALDTTTGEVTPPAESTGRSAWPPRSKGPLPPVDALPEDFHIGTAQDEIDAWAHEHDDATNVLARLRRELAGDEHTDGAEVEVMRARARYRRIARATPTERGRRTAQDIDEEVNEKLADDAHYRRKLDLETSVEIALDRLFRAKDNIARLQRYIDTLPRDPGTRYHP